MEMKQKPKTLQNLQRSKQTKRPQLGHTTPAQLEKTLHPKRKTTSALHRSLLHFGATCNHPQTRGTRVTKALSVISASHHRPRTTVRFTGLHRSSQLHNIHRELLHLLGFRSRKHQSPSESNSFDNNEPPQEMKCRPQISFSPGELLSSSGESSSVSEPPKILDQRIKKHRYFFLSFVAVAEDLRLQPRSHSTTHEPITV
ncbi:hypothetical protein Rs2_38792 [Raphanus sativus]|nr:hypothetical protein Rs2_38792 [Raphanus sativus]